MTLDSALNARPQAALLTCTCTRSAVLVPLMADTNPFSRKRAHADPRAWHVPASTPRTSSSVAPWSQPLPTADPPTTTGLSLGRRLLPPAPAASMSSNVPPAADRTHVVRLAADDIEDISDDDDSFGRPPVRPYVTSEAQPPVAPPQHSRPPPSGAYALAASAPPLALPAPPLPSPPPPPLPPFSAARPSMGSALQRALPPAATPAAPPRSSFVASMRLSTAQLGETVTAKSSGRAGGRRLSGACSAFVLRAANEAAAATQMLLVRHCVAGPSVPSFETLCAAMHAVRHRVLRPTRVLATAPLVMLEAIDEAEVMLEAIDEAEQNGRGVDGRSPTDAGDDSAYAAVGTELPSPPPPLRVLMSRATFDRACGGGGGRFVVFAPFLEASRGACGRATLLLASHAEALPYPTLPPPPSLLPLHDQRDPHAHAHAPLAPSRALPSALAAQFAPEDGERASPPCSAVY